MTRGGFQNKFHKDMELIHNLVSGNTMCVSTCQVELFLENCLA